MNDGSSMTSQVPLAFYDPDLSSWKTSQESLLLEEPSLLDRLPGSGTTVAGRLYERATPALLIDVRAGSALLPTPAAWDGNRGPDNSRLQGDGHRPSGQAGTLNLAGALQMLPTPTTSDRNGPGEHGDGGPDLRTTVSVLPTPTASEWNSPGIRKRGQDLRTTVSLLPTPRAQNGDPRNMRPWVRPLDQPQNLENVIGRLLPTPMAGDCKVFGPNIDWEKRGEKQGLPGLVMTQLLPTPTTRDYKDVGENTDYEKIAKKHKLPGVIMSLPSEDGKPPSEDQPQPQPTPED